MAIRKPLTDLEFATLYEDIGCTALARRLDQSQTAVRNMRRRIEDRLRIKIVRSPHYERPEQHPHRIPLKVDNGIVLVGSDAHIWPGPLTTAMRGFIQFIKDMKPAAVVLNGDVMDFSQISRHDPLGWEKQPKVVEEIEAAQDVLHQIAMAAGRARKIWTFGNHDQRYERKLAVVAPEYEQLAGMHLKDHFPNWEPCWSCWINDDTVIKHRYRAGIHAPWNNVINAGTNIITAHLHSAKVIPFTHYKGTLFGVDDGCLCDPDHRAFLYAEDSPKNWRSGFCVLNFRNGRLLQPQLALVHDANHMDFCGQLVPIHEARRKEIPAKGKPRQKSKRARRLGR